MSLNVPSDPLLLSIESIGGVKRPRLNTFYCTRCGTFHDAITLCPRFEDDFENKNSYFYQKYDVNVNQNNCKTLLQKYVKECEIEKSSKNNSDLHIDGSNYENCSIIKTPRDSDLPSTSKCVSFDLKDSLKDKQCKKYVQDKCINVSYDENSFNTDAEDECINIPCEKDLQTLHMAQEKIETVVTNEQGTDSFDTDATFFERFGWCSFHERLHGAGYNYPYADVLPAITKIEEEQILENTEPPAPWTKEGKVYRKKIFKLTYPQHNPEYHKYCKGKYGNRKPVPPWMGWLWNISDDCMMGSKYNNYFRPGWRPGAMNCKIAKMIKQHRGGYEEIFEKPKRKPKKRKREEDEDIRPMIIIMKRHGCYLITMNPIANPYVPSEQNVECAPIHFIVDQRKNKVERVKPKPKCDCNCECECDALEDIEELSSQITISDEENDDDDEFELEFTPPICLVDHETLMKKKHNTEEKGSQTEEIVTTPTTGKHPTSPKKGKKKSAKAK